MAVEMSATVMKNGKDPQMIRMAKAISSAQKKEIAHSIGGCRTQKIDGQGDADVEITDLAAHHPLTVVVAPDGDVSCGDLIEPQRWTGKAFSGMRR